MDDYKQFFNNQFAKSVGTSNDFIKRKVPVYSIQDESEDEAQAQTDESDQFRERTGQSNQIGVERQEINPQISQVDVTVKC